METKLEKPRALAHILSEDDHGRSRDVVTVLSGEGVLEAGTILGVVTASGKCVASPHAEVTGKEGAETATAVLAYAVDATSADAMGVVSARATQLKGKQIIYHSSVDDAAKTETKNGQLKAVGLIVR